MSEQKSWSTQRLIKLIFGYWAALNTASFLVPYSCLLATMSSGIELTLN